MTAVPLPADAGARTDRRPTMLAVGTTVWLSSELMFFAGLFASYFTIKAADPNWPGPDVRLSTLRDAAFTLLLVASSFTMQRAVHLLSRERRSVAIRWIVATIVLGSVFLTNQAVEWTQVPFRPSTSSYGSLFFVMTGFHGLHVLFGLLAMVGLLLRLMTAGSSDRGAKPVAEVITYYWHFVDVVWLGLFATLFFIR
jgi:cytochrome c oxidase subunit III